MYTDITKISRMAKLHQRENPEVIDATNGVYYDETGRPGYSDTFDRIKETIEPNDKYIYGAVSGGKDFQNNVIKWLFKDYEFSQTPVVFASMGGTGALSNAFDIYAISNKTVLTSELHWHNYRLMAKTHKMNFETFPISLDEAFDIDSFDKIASRIIDREGRLMLVLNQPAHNPTGYSFNKNDIIKLIDILKAYLVPIIILYDIAYLDLAKDKAYFDVFDNLPDNIVTILAYSFSKSLGLYGLRLGASIMLGGSQELRNEFYEMNYLYARTKWNTPNQEAVLTFNKIMSDENLIRAVEHEIEIMKKTLKSRSDYLISFFKTNKIIFYPYSDGFFITIKTDKPNDLFEAFQKQLIYGVVVEKGLRLAISALNLDKIKLMCKRILAVYK